MRTAGEGKVGELWHSSTVEKWVVHKQPFLEDDKHPLDVNNAEDAITIGRLLKKSGNGVFITHVTEVHYHLLVEEPDE